MWKKTNNERNLMNAPVLFCIWRQEGPSQKNGRKLVSKGHFCLKAKQKFSILDMNILTKVKHY